MDILHKIMQLLWENHIKEGDFCESLGISKSAVTEWKKGRTKSYMKHLPKIADYFGVPISYFENNENIEKSPSELTEGLNTIDSILIDKITQLPPEKKKQAFEYLDFLLSKHQDN